MRTCECIAQENPGFTVAGALVEVHPALPPGDYTIEVKEYSRAQQPPDTLTITVVARETIDAPVRVGP